MDLYIARHGESLGNTGEKSCEDPELSARGREQAECLALRMKNIHLDAVISSPYIRAVETAAATARLKEMEIELLPLLFEAGTCPGYEGIGLSELRKIYPHIAMYSDPNPYPLSVTEENTEITYKRAVDAIDRIRCRFGDDASVILFAHGSFNNYLINAAIGFPVRSDFNFCQENTGLTCIRFVKDNGKDKTKIEFSNDYCHLYHTF